MPGPDASGTAEENADYSFNLYDRQGNIIYPAGVMHYNGAESIVSLHNYPMSDKENIIIMNLRAVISGPVMQIPQTDCVSPRLIIWQLMRRHQLCRTHFEGKPRFTIADTMDTEAVKIYARNGNPDDFGENSVLYYTDPGLELTDLYDKDGVHYTSELLE